MKFTFDARTPELLRTDICKYIASCVDVAEGQRYLATRKADKATQSVIINLLSQIITDIKNADLDSTPL